LYQAIQDHPGICTDFSIFKNISSKEETTEVLEQLSEQEIWQLFDDIKDKYGLRVFGKGYMYRIISDELIFDVSKITDNQKLKDINGSRTYVPYDKGDKEGNRWYLETPYLINWSEDAVSWLKKHSGTSGVGMPVVRNPQFYFRKGFCWTNVLNPNTQYFKCRLKARTVNDVGSMSLYDEVGLGDEYFVLSLNSFLQFKILREFFNSTVNVQLNDIRKLPIKIPNDKELEAFKDKFNECLEIKKVYFNGEIDRNEMKDKLRPVEKEIDRMVNAFYGYLLL